MKEWSKSGGGREVEPFFIRNTNWSDFKTRSRNKRNAKGDFLLATAFLRTDTRKRSNELPGRRPKALPNLDDVMGLTNSKEVGRQRLRHVTRAMEWHSTFFSFPTVFLSPKRAKRKHTSKICLQRSRSQNGGWRCMKFYYSEMLFFICYWNLIA